MTIQQLEKRLNDLERKVVELQRQLGPLRPFGSVQETFGMFANDPDFDEMVQFGRDYRNEANSDGEPC